jgi:hypothetical protein
MLEEHYKWFVVGTLWLVCFFSHANRQFFRIPLKL